MKLDDLVFLQPFNKSINLLDTSCNLKFDFCIIIQIEFIYFNIFILLKFILFARTTFNDGRKEEGCNSFIDYYLLYTNYWYERALYIIKEHSVSLYC